jgi:pilus assembly protein CpaE
MFESALCISKDEQCIAQLGSILSRNGLLHFRKAKQVGVAIHMLSSEHPQVIFLDEELCSSTIEETLRSIANVCHTAKIIYITSAEKRHIVKNIASGSISGYVLKPIDEVEIVQVLRRAKHSKQKPISIVEKVIEQEEQSGRIVTLYSTMFGVGKTTLGVNLAAALSLQEAGKICIVDADLQFGDVASYLDMSPASTIADFAVSIDKKNPASGFLTNWQSKVDLLASPIKVEEAELITPYTMGGALNSLTETHDIVIVDTPVGFSDLTINIIDSSDVVLFICNVDYVPSIKNMRVGLDLLKNLGYDGKVELVLNRDKAKKMLDARQVESILETTFRYRIVNDYEISVQAIKTGSPFVITQPSSTISRQVKEMASGILKRMGESDENVKEKKSLLQRIGISR